MGCTDVLKIALSFPLFLSINSLFVVFYYYFILFFFSFFFFSFLVPVEAMGNAGSGGSEKGRRMISQLLAKPIDDDAAGRKKMISMFNLYDSNKDGRLGWAEAKQYIRFGNGKRRFPLVSSPPLFFSLATCWN